MTAVENALATGCGLPSRYADAATLNLNRLSRTFEDIQGVRKAHAQRLAQDLYGPGELTAEQKAAVAEHPETVRWKAFEDVHVRELVKVLKGHVLYPWLKPLKGLAGARTGRLIAAIGDPWRFPGQRCSEGHTFRPVLPVGSPCPLTETRYESETRSGVGAGDADHADEREGRAGDSCPGIIQPPRPHSGVRSLWHYLGLMPGQDGNLIRRRKGVQASYSPQVRALLLGDMGIADQIVRQRTDPYRAVYDRVKASKVAPADAGGESDRAPGGLPPWRADKIARTVATKHFVGDLLTEWKSRTEVTA